MKRLLPIWLCLLALAVTQLYGQQKSLQQAVESDMYTVTFFATPTEGGTLTAVYFDENSRLVTLQSGEQIVEYTGLYITAKPSDGYKLEKWIVNGDELPLNADRPLDYSCRVEEDLIVEAVFKDLNPEPKTFELTLTPSEGGKIIAKADGSEITDLTHVAQGTIVTIEATPETGYELTALTARSEDILATKSFEMKEATEVKATFTKLQKNYVVTLQSNEHGSISIQEKVDLKAVPEGTKLTVVAKGANDKCVLTKLTANGKDILKDMTFTVTEDVTVVAEFVDHTGLETATTATLSLYPNPAKEYAIVAGLVPKATVALYTLEGQLITLLRADRSGSLQIDLTALSDGTYLVVTESASQRLVVKH